MSLAPGVSFDVEHVAVLDEAVYESRDAGAVLFRLHTAKKAETRDLKPRARLLRACLGDQ